MKLIVKFTKIIFITFIIITVALYTYKIIANIKQKKQQTKIVTANIENIKYEILVDVEDSRLYLFKDKELKETYKCSGGKWSTPSPIGTWKVTSKAKWGEGFRTEVGLD